MSERTGEADVIEAEVEYPGTFDRFDARGPVILRRKPAEQLVDHEAFGLPEHAERADFERCADWVVARGGEVPFHDHLGLLVRSVYLNEFGHPDGEFYHEWVSGGSLLVHNVRLGEFTTYGYTMGREYDVEPASSTPAQSAVSHAATPATTDQPEGECGSCGEGSPNGECPKSKRPCGHHCNHVWTHDACDWCGKEFGETDQPEVRREPEAAGGGS